MDSETAYRTIMSVARGMSTIDTDATINTAGQLIQSAELLQSQAATIARLTAENERLTQDLPITADGKDARKCGKVWIVKYAHEDFWCEADGFVVWGVPEEYRDGFMQEIEGEPSQWVMAVPQYDGMDYYPMSRCFADHDEAKRFQQAETERHEAAERARGGESDRGGEVE